MQHAASLRRALLALLVATAVVAGASPASAMTGPDISGWQHPNGAGINWAAVRASGQSFVFVKATEGAGYVNPYFAGDWASSHAAGLVHGAYHYARPSLTAGSATAQARWYVAQAGLSRQRGDLPPVLDLEEAGGLTPAQLRSWARSWLTAVQRATGRLPIIYTYPYFWRTAMGGTSAFAAYPLWIADYSARTSPTLLGVWPRWTFWQYSATSSVPGVPGPGALDMNRFNGSTAELAALANGKALPALQVSPAVPANLRTLAAYGSSTLGQGDPNRAAVEAVQTALHVTADGSFGPVTGAAVADLQRSHSLPVTGVVGPAEWLLLYPRPVDPFGAVETATLRLGVVHVTGWAADADSASPLQVRVAVDGRQVRVLTTDVPRPDRLTAFPGISASSGYALDLTVPEGRHAVCVTATNVGPGARAQLGCRTVSVVHSPRGRSERLRQTADALVASGWASDPDVVTPPRVRLTVDGRRVAGATAGLSRPDVVKAPYTGGGYRLSVPLRGLVAGTHRVCVVVADIGPGSDTTLGCRRTVVRHNPFGHLDRLGVRSGRLTVAGWAIEPDGTVPAQVQVTVDGHRAASGPADRLRPGVVKVEPLYGVLHGYRVVLPVPVAAGGHRICLTATNTGPGRSATMGCRTLTVPG